MAALQMGAMVVGLLMAGLGGMGLIAPSDWIAMVSAMQSPPGIYVAAAIRMVAGAVIFFSATASRMPRTLRIIGAVIFVGGILTPFVGIWVAYVIKDAWTMGGHVAVRGWGAVAMMLGAFVFLSSMPRRPAT
jgi:hypothetical protein